MPDLKNSFIVAGAGADLAKRRAADYIADGTDDDVIIQQAIDALPSAGGEVLLLGDFNVASMIEYRSGVKLRGLGATLIVDDDIDDNAITRDGLPCVAAIGPSDPTSLRSASIAVTDESQNIAVEKLGAVNCILNISDEFVYVYDGDQTATVGDNKSTAQLKAIAGYHQLSPGASITFPPSVASFTIVCTNGNSASFYSYAHVGVTIENIDIDYSGTKQDTCWHAGVWLDNCADSHVHDCNIDDVARPTGTTYRQFCGLITDSYACSASGGQWTRAGYEAIGMRGNCWNCEARDIYTMESVVHAAQTASMHYGDVTGTYGGAVNCGFVRIITGQIQKDDYRGQSFDGGDIILHGDTAADPRGLYVRDCRCAKVLIVNKARDVAVRGNHITHEVKIYGIASTSNIAIDSVLIDANTFNEETGNSHWLYIDTGTSTTGDIGDIRATNNFVKNGHNTNGNAFVYVNSSVDIKGVWFQGNSINANSYPFRLQVFSSGNIEDVFVDGNHIVASSILGGIRLHTQGSGDILRVRNTNNIWDTPSIGRMHNIVTTSSGVVRGLEISGNTIAGGTAIVYFDSSPDIDHVVYRDNRHTAAITAVFEGAADSGTTADYYDNQDYTAPTAVDSASLGGNLTSGNTTIA